MRQTIECEQCAKSYKARQDDVGECVSLTYGFPLRVGLFCDGCAEPLQLEEVVVAVGVWHEDIGMYNNARWASNYIRVATTAEIQIYRQAEASAKEMRKDGDRDGTV